MSATTLLRSLVRNADGLAQPGAYLLVRDGDVFADLPETLPIIGGTEAQVVRTPTELHLRHALWCHRATSVIALVPPEWSCPPDLREQAVKRKVHTLTHTEVLRTVLGTSVIAPDDPDLHQLAVQHAEQIRTRLKLHTTPTVVDRELLEQTLVEVVSELSNLGLTSGNLGPLVARWATEPPSLQPAVCKLATRVLTQQGPFGAIVAWALNQPHGCRHLIVHGAVLSANGDVSEGAWGPLAALRAAHDSLRLDELAVRPHLVQLATEAVHELGTAALPLLAAADTVARSSVAPGALANSQLLPLAFDERAHDIAQRLLSGDADVSEWLNSLSEHLLADGRRDELELLAGMVRLARYLATPRQPLASPSEYVYAYAQDHAFADRCVREVERSLASTAAHRDAATKLIDRVVAARDALNHAWAENLAGDYKRTLLAQDYSSLSQLTRAHISPRLAKSPVFLLVLDGCSMPVWLDLLDQLNDLPTAIGLERPVMSAPDVALAPLPTITSHARGALFLGEVPRDPFAAETVFRDEQERKTDPARFNQNKGLGTASRKLFLKGDLTDGGVALQRELQGDTRVVGAVFNAVDDRIGSHNTGQAWRMDVRDIRGLLPAITTALNSGRRVLVTADHGHSPFRGNAGFAGAGSTPRYAVLPGDEPVPSGFIEVDCAGLSGQDGRMAFAYQQGVYRGQQQVGFHGGCSLEEMVVPVAWLALGSHGVPKPRWWTTLVSEAAETPRPRAPRSTLPPPTAPPLTAPAPTADSQPVEEPPVGIETSPAATPAPTADVSTLPSALRSGLSEADQALLAYVLQHGPVRTELLAAFAKRPPHRMRGHLAQLARKVAAKQANLVGADLPDGEKQWSLELS